MAQRIVKTAKALRKRSTDVERLLWGYLRVKQMEGLKFRRQQPIGKYVVDFVCFEKKIIIEVDGGQHAVETKKDTERDEWLRSQGFKVLRFWNNEVLTNTQAVLEMIRINCLSRSHPPLNPLPSREGKEKEISPSREGKEKRNLSPKEGKERGNLPPSEAIKRD